MLTKKSVLKNREVSYVSAYKLYQQTIQRPQIIPTGVKRIDELLDGGLQIGRIVEICGQPTSAKSQLSLSIAVNVASRKNIETIYVDTKHDLSGVVIRNMLRSRRYTENVIAETLQKIRVARIYSVEKLIELFENLDKRMTDKDNSLVIIIDSLPSLMYLHHGEAKFEGLNLLAESVLRMRKLVSRHQVAILVVNIITCGRKWTPVEKKKPEEMRLQKPSLGKHWQTVPCVRLLSKWIIDSHAVSFYNFANQMITGFEVSARRNFIICIEKSDFTRSGRSCHIHHH
ncbi:DNA repair protein RAD51 homolog 4 isoform X1 [Hermetia illucens]|uniref:DNA repair protein RAD51 homolog 4 isoform X1 n=1 Tax=Hermetia illucens TaxID=343691 RepID=UPI0018CC18DA|nr:DNA repair protein RAD51 homolog 4 isoform X1 [Hermetia illucens]